MPKTAYALKTICANSLCKISFVALQSPSNSMGHAKVILYNKNIGLCLFLGVRDLCFFNTAALMLCGVFLRCL